MKQMGPAGFSAFLQGLDGQSYNPSGSSIHGPSFIANLTSQAIYYCNYYGLYPSPYQMSTRSLPTSILSQYSLSVDDKYGYVFQEWNDWIAGATYNHIGSDDKTHGVLTAMGLTRTPDIRIAALALLTYYHPTLYKEEFTAEGTSRLVSLQLAQQGGT